MSHDNMTNGDMGQFTYTGPGATLAKGERSSLDVLLSNLSSALSLAVLMTIATWVALIVPVAILLWKAAL